MSLSLLAAFNVKKKSLFCRVYDHMPLGGPCVCCICSACTCCSCSALARALPVPASAVHRRSAHTQLLGKFDSRARTANVPGTFCSLACLDLAWLCPTWLGLAWIASMDKDEGVHPAEKGNGTAGCKEAGRGLPCPTYQQMSLCGNKSCLWRGGPAGARARTHMCWDPRALLGSPKCCTGKLLGGVPTTCGAAATEQHKGVLALVHSSKQVSS